ncbi:hypothetical protein AVEN_112636-1 [Araneus ventricosus]|uniref:Reverse transcriptase domain-containing protein n=1 Tax=Araneus ventricosus TaxID=182803 RepID=A0A4Y2S5B7_ARAVE|nr:hypothetical protein AVEN_112636-1 [Araneus ventricosus]
MQTSEGPVLWEQTQGCPQGSCSGPAFWNMVADEILSVQWPQGVHLQAFADDFAFIVTDNTREGLRKLSKLELDNFNRYNRSQIKLATTRNRAGQKSHVSIPTALQNRRKTWGINKNIRRLLYKTVIERTLCHGAAAWGHNMISRLQKKLDSIQRLFLLYIIGAYRTAPTAALQVITGLQPFHLQIQQEAIYARVARARSSSNFFTFIFSPTDYESKSSGIHIHTPNFLIHNQI